MIVHKTNMDLMKQEAERISTENAERGSSRKIVDYKWKEGDNILRLLPSWGAHGRLFRKEATHWSLQPGNAFFRCLLETWPSKTDRCPICDAISQLLALFPDMDFWRQMPAVDYRCNVLDRDEPDKGSQIARFKPRLYNWVVTEINSTAGDVVDIERGIDLKVTVKITTKKGGGKRTDYDPKWIPRPTRLAENDDLAYKILTGIKNLDELSPYPNDEKIGAMHKQAAAMLAYYTKKIKQDSDAGKAQGSTAAHDELNPPPPTDADNKSDRKKESQKSPAPEPKPSVEVVAPSSDSKKPPVKLEEPKKPISTLAGVDPRGMPSCFAGLESPECHDGSGVPDDVRGTFGFSEKLEKCLICEHELRCLAAKESSGL